MFIGSVSTLIRNQMSSDIYLSFVWTAQGELLRVVHICITHGLAVVLIQQGICPQPGVIPGQWIVHGPSLYLITVNDQGPQYMNVHGAPQQLPNAHQIQHGVNTFYRVNGVLVAAKAVPWHHRVTLQRSESGALLHYHQHAPREGHESQPPDILPQDEGSYKAFRRLAFSTQVQNCRTIQGYRR